MKNQKAKAKKSKYAVSGELTVTWDENSSHGGVLRQVVDGLVKKKFAPRKEIESEFIILLGTKVYRYSEA